MSGARAGDAVAAPQGPEVVTFGCRLNAFESEAMRRVAIESGLGDAVIVNTCAVTTEAVRQARQAIRKLRRDRPDARIIVAGCAAQLDPESFAAMPEVDRVLGNVEKLDAAALASSARRIVVSDVTAARETAPHLLDGFDGRARAFVQVQQGCDHRCTFCIIPFARGPSGSVPAERAVAQVARLTRAGYAEIVLTGVDICSWGMDLAERPRLGDLVGAILDGVPQLGRLRLSTLDPAAIDDGLLAALGRDERLAPHLHLSLQAADDLTLKRMKRRHRRADVARLVERARRARPDVVFGADLIAGFPTEDDAMAERTRSAVEEFGLTWLHVFPYSARPGTPAARMPQTPVAIRKERAARLRAAGATARTRFFASRVGAETRVLVESGDRGRCPHYAPVRLRGAEWAAAAGSIVPVRIDGFDDDGLIGTRP